MFALLVVYCFILSRQAGARKISKDIFDCVSLTHMKLLLEKQSYTHSSVKAFILALFFFNKEGNAQKHQEICSTEEQ